MTDRQKYRLWDVGARLCTALPPMGAALYFFPLWVEKSSGATFSGMALVALLVCLIPFWKKLSQVGKHLTETSMPVLWVVLFGLLFLLRSILDQMLIIALVGLGASLISMLLCARRNRYSPDRKEE